MKHINKVLITTLLLISLILLCEVSKAEDYTGIVIDAHGMGVQPGFNLAITDHSGTKLCGITDINYIYQYAYEKGNRPVESLTNDWKDIVGNKPLVVKAIEIRDKEDNKNIIVALSSKGQVYKIQKNVVLVI